MADDEEPPSLGKAAPSAPPTSAFGGSGTAPPSAAFSHSAGGGDSNNNSDTPPSDDLNKRWKQYEQEMETRRSESSLTKSAKSDSSNYKLPDSVKRGVSEGAASGDYSFKKSTSYDTNELIRKYASVTGIPPAMSSGLPRPSSFRRSSSAISQTSAAVREEAMQVLDLVDEHLNAPFSVRRTESGGFRAQASSLAGGSGAGNITAPYSVRRTESGAVMVEHEGTEDAEGTIQPYFVKRTSSGTVTTGRGPRRTPAALSGLGLSDSSTNNSRTQFRSGRYSFSDPKFREDDFLAEEEDDIIGPSVSFDENDPNIEVPISPPSKYRDDGSTAFDGDFPRGSSTWSSRYSDNPQKTKKMLSDYDQGYYGSRDRQSARNMFMSTASSMRDTANHVGGAMATKSANVFGSGFSFRQSHTFGNQKDSFNLRSMWKNGEDDQFDDESVQGNQTHKTWQQVMLNKKRRRRIGCSILCLILACIALGIGMGATKEKRSTAKGKFSGYNIGEPITFYATCDTPFNAHEAKQLEGTLATIPEDGEFFIHLGNLQDAAENSCPPSRMYEMADMFRKSPIPFINIPGEEDWVKCPDQALSFARWLNAFEDIDENFDSAMVHRSENNPELFVFNQNGVLFFGLHLVNGSIRDLRGHDARMKDMAVFFLGMLNFYKGEFRSVVIMGNAHPGHQQHRFFESVSGVLERMQVPTVYVHADSGLGSVEYTPIEEFPFIHGIQVPNGGQAEPLRISVGFGETPFVVG